MPEPKYGKLHAEGFSDCPKVPFSLDYLTNKSRFKRMTGAILQRGIWPLMWSLLRIYPVVKVGKFVLLTRAADVRAALKDPGQFPMPFGPEMEALGNGATFALGLDGDPHVRQRKIIEAAYRRKDVAMMEEQALTFAQALLDAGKGEIDAAQDLIRRVLVENSMRYIGIQPSDPNDLADWVMACSNLLFADPFGDSTAREIGMAGAARINILVDQRVEALIAANSRSDGTVIERLVTAHLDDRTNGPSPAEIRAMVLGLLVGSVPTTTLGGGRILEELAARPQAREDMVRAAGAYMAGGVARAAAMPRLEAILQELLRLNPTISPVMFRWCPRPARLEPDGGGQIDIAAGSTVMLATRTALRDPRETKNPDRYDPDRKDRAEFVFGTHSHNCFGERMAIGQLRALFAALMAREGASESMARLKIERIGPYPCKAMVRYRHATPSQIGVFIAIPAPDGDVAAIDAKIDAVATDRLGDLRDRLDGIDFIHFASISAAPIRKQGDKGDETEPMIFVEINADGDGSEAIHAIAEVMEAPLKEIFREAQLLPDDDLATFLERYRLPPTALPWGATALQFHGRKDFSVKDVRRHERIAAFANEKLQLYFQKELGRVASASAALRQVRAEIWAADGDDAWMGPFLLKPSTQKMPISIWPGMATLWETASRRPMRIIGRVSLALALLFALVLASSIQLTWPGLLRGPMLTGWLLLQGLMLLALVMLLVGGAIAALLRWHEKNDKEERGPPSIDHLKAVTDREDPPGHVNNHIFVVTPLKRGLFRRLSLAAALVGINETLVQRFRPGFVSSMGTIHFARWIRLPGRDTLIFQADYDGNWESYLEDFITRVHQGQTAAWSHAEGYPRSEWLILKGAQDGDHFKRYVRRKQLPTRFWYARFPHLTNDQIRRDALIHDGLCRASTETEARGWLALFGSAQPTPEAIESDEIQSIVFSGYGRLPFATTLLLRFTGQRAAGEWLRTLTGFSNAPIPAVAYASKMGGVDDGERRSARVTFGEDERLVTAVNVALSAQGLKYLGLPDDTDEMGMRALPGPFHLGMAERGRRLGDEGVEDPSQWRWSDGGDNPVHAALLLYGATQQDLDWLRNVDSLTRGLTVVAEVAAMPLPADGKVYEHFGFRDAVIQPVIAGTRRAAKPQLENDIVPPGEMIVGYANSQGFLTPGIPVSPLHDPANRLPEMPRKPDRFPRFGANGQGERIRDFGRNGAFLAIRMLEQNVDGPEGFLQVTQDVARAINLSYPHLDSILGKEVDASWVAAKMVGRWKHGAPLVGYSFDPGPQWTERPMLFGTDDPSGHQCPLGAHARRSNPRDSLLPGDSREMSIVNRHRLLRRGRSYEIPGQAGTEKGLMFMAICEDLERQFEFVQRNWLDSPTFHTLDRQNDPLIGRCPAGKTREFDIPTPSGTIKARGLPQFVHVRAGGYFFLPSRSAMLWLADV